MISTQACQHDFNIPAISAGRIYYGSDSRPGVLVHRVFSQTGHPDLRGNMAVACRLHIRDNEDFRPKGVSGV